MTLHYHVTPITPTREMHQLAGRHFCVSFWRPDQVRLAHEIGQSVMLDNGAFSAWRQRVELSWPDFYAWAELWLEYLTSWAVIPDVIDGGEEENDRLLAQWPHGERGAPVWHLHESLGRLLRLVDEWPLVCLGSSGEYADLRSQAWRYRMEAVFNAVAPTGQPPRLHMLRGMGKLADYPFYSVDSSNIGQNHGRDGGAAAKAIRLDAVQSPVRWVPRLQTSFEVARGS